MWTLFVVVFGLGVMAGAELNHCAKPGHEVKQKAGHWLNVEVYKDGIFDHSYRKWEFDEF